METAMLHGGGALPSAREKMKLPRQWLHPTWIERCFLAALVLLCVILTTVQYRWTGEISRRTAESLRASFGDQAALFCQAFDTELTNACNELLPYEDELKPGNRASVHIEHFRRWAAGKHRPIFRQIGYASFTHGSLQLYLVDQKSMTVAPVAWPSAWVALHQNLDTKNGGKGSPPFQDETGTLLEFPIFGGQEEDEWMILEIDPDYLRKTWLPELVATYLTRDGQAICDATVQTATDPSRTIYTTGTAVGTRNERAVSLRFNRRGREHAGGGRRGGENCWQLIARQPTGALEATVATAHWRNLALSGLLPALTLAAGISLVRYTRRSRKLAARQMQFVANVSHELRTPLTVIRGAGHNLARGIIRDPAHIEQYGRFIIQHADQLTGLIEQMLVLADARRTRSVANHAPIDLSDVLAGAVADTLAETRAAGCKVEATILSGLPKVSGDASALRRVFRNLIGNAAKYAASGGWIGVHAATLGDASPPMVEVRVADHGPGIPEGEQATIFEPFVRGSMAQKQQIRGSGLGLNLVREVVEAHQGVVSVRSERGQGTTFTVRLPALSAI